MPVEVELRPIFRRRGLIGAGAGLIAQTSPYRGADAVRVQAIPAVTYIGERVQVLGPYAQAGVASWRGMRLAATARYRLGAYAEDDSEFLDGMGDRKDSLFCGLALQGMLPAGIRVSAGYEHDALDRVGLLPAIPAPLACSLRPTKTSRASSRSRFGHNSVSSTTNRPGLAARNGRSPAGSSSGKAPPETRPEP